MAVKERAQQFERLLKGCVLWPSGELETMARGVIEQALLAERRLAMEEAAKIAAKLSDEWTDRVRTDEHTRGMADGADFVAMALRAAAEKEVGKR